jgi:hypothetical protein
VKKKLLASALLACSLVTLGAVSAARAASLTSGTTVLETVDSVEASAGSSSSLLRVEGIVEGESVPRVLEINFSAGANAQVTSERCLKFLLLAQSHPGRYKIEIVTFDQSSLANTCRLRSR